jgi:hypothetical protein
MLERFLKRVSTGYQALTVLEGLNRSVQFTIVVYVNDLVAMRTIQLFSGTLGFAHVNKS